MSDLLTLDGMSVAYGKRGALKSVSPTIGPGEIVTLLGANGSGKSTTSARSRLVRPRAGRVVSDGRDITRAAPDAIVAAGIGHVPEGGEIFPQFTVHENLLVGGHTAPRAGIGEATERAFALFPSPAPRAHAPAREHLVGRRAADARDRARRHDPAAPASARRATARPRPASHPRDLRRHRAHQRRRGDRPARRAEGATRAGPGLARVRAGDRACRGHPPPRELAADPRIRAAYLGLAGPPAS